MAVECNVPLTAVLKFLAHSQFCENKLNSIKHSNTQLYHSISHEG